MIKEEYRSKLTSILAELNEIKFVNSREIFKLDMDLIKDVTSLLDYEHSAEGVFPTETSFETSKARKLELSFMKLIC